MSSYICGGSFLSKNQVCAVSIFLACFAFLIAPAALAQSSPVADYSFSEGTGTAAADLSGNNNNGTLQAGATWTTAGKYGNALSFDGVNGFVSVPASSTLNLGSSGTIEAWVKPNAINRWNSVLAKGNTNSDPPTNYGLEINNSNRFLCILGDGSSARTLASTTAVTTGTFYHVACVWNGSQLQLYVNGALNTSVAQNLTPAANTSPLFIGQYGGNADRMNGIIDEVRIYSRALSQTEVQTDMNTPIAPPGPAPTVSGIDQTSGIQGQVLNVVITGTNFVNNATCSFGAGITVNSCTFNSAIQMTANIAIAANATTGPRNVTVTNPDGQSGTLASAFTVNAAPPPPPPTLSSISVLSGQQGQTLSDTLTGTNFVTGATCSFGAGITVNSCTVNSATQMTANITIAGNAAIGTRNVTVTNPDTQSATLTNAFTVNQAPAPTLSSISPTSGAQGQTLSDTLTGTNFVTGATCSFGAGITVNSCTRNSATQMTANITIAGNAAIGTRNVTVTNPDTQSATLTNAFTVNAAPPAGAAYPFSEGAGVTAADLSGNNNNGTLQGGVTWTTAGKYGNALSFDGVNGFVSVPASSTLNLGSSGTIEAWVKPNAVNVWNSVMAKGNSNDDPPTNYGLEINSNNQFLCILGNGSSARTLASATAVTPGTFYHVACVWNGSQLRLYVNGVLDASVAQNLTPAANASPLYIGQYGGDADRMNGIIDEVRIYARALSQTEVQTDMRAPVDRSLDTGPPTVSMTAPTAGAVLAGRTTLYADASDDLGVASVQFYVDGSPFGPEISVAPFTTTWDTTSSTNGSHTITAIATDGVGNQTTAAPVAVTVSNTSDPSLVGAWTAPFNWPIVAINMVVTRNGDVMSWDGAPSNGGTSALQWSPTSGVFTSIPNNLTNMFCNAAVVLSDGRVLAIGGHSDFGIGLTNTDIYNPTTRLWTPQADMHHARWYPTATVLADGRVLAMSGSDTCEECIVSIPEIYDPVSNTWTELTNAPLDVALYPHIFVLPDGRVLQAGASRSPEVTSVLDLNTETWTTVDPNPVDGHSGVMYELGKIMKSGSSADVSVSTAPSASTTYTLDMTQPSPKWQQTPNMAYPRAFHNLTLLPDGSVLATGGGSTRDGVNYANSVLAGELWSPQTKTWTTMSAEQKGRLYHGTAVLLLDGRVLVAGSGRVGPTPQFNAEIFSPPYLFKGPRPTISSIPGSAGYGSTFFVGTPNAVSSVTLLRISAATHAFNMDQRFLRLNFSPTAGGLNVTAPANANLAPPGYYVLYILNSSGVPSTGAVIQIQ
jgi:hypothetical protein